MKKVKKMSPSPRGGEGWGEGKLLLLLLLMSCGYRFTAPNASLPGGVRSAHVPFFINRTAEPGAELSFTQAARDQLDRAGRLGGPDAEGVLEGTITSVGSGPFLSAPTLIKQPVFRMTAGLTLTLKKSGVAVGTASVSVSEEFPSGPDVLLTESNRAAALRRLADAAVREALERLQTAP
jgi:hypothetical protein